MKFDSEIRIPKNHWKLVLFVLGSLTFVFIGYMMVMDVDSFTRRHRSGSGFTQAMGLAGILFFGMAGILILVNLISGKPALIINGHGIVNHSNAVGGFLIRWPDMGRIQIKTVQKTKFITIHVKDPEIYLAQAGVFKRFWMKLNCRIYGTPIMITTNTLKIGAEELLELIKENKKKYRIKSSIQP